MRKLLLKTETLFFQEGPAVFHHAAIAIMGFGLLGTAVLMALSGDPWSLRFLWFAAMIAVPAVVCALLSITIKTRHAATVPLVFALCAISAYVFLRDPSQAADGISPYIPTLIGAWIVAGLEVALIIALISFSIYLWRKGAFK